ncbi:Sec-independent protein translocase protein TatB [Acidihalobacter prosperus]|uniref:Sec-independent protein translocase protein TatB n=1 Tax=Acidihalobacter prosperus TaxID=160660 RepID=A0A1A6C111_9GAMM|nr:Sec-independent protein translocase protein TatB [Acidihalobacter prosperus]OBS08251.1 Twin-arginine translocation protein TatB [Acidihalobacter prosperus]
MFDSGFSELMLIMIVALVVVGPERLPGLVRKIGYWVGRFRRYATTVRAEIERELNADELRSMLSRQEDEIRELRDMLQDTREQMRGEVDDIAENVRQAGALPAEPTRADGEGAPAKTPDDHPHGASRPEPVASAPVEPGTQPNPAAHPEPAPADKTTHGRKSE